MIVFPDSVLLRYIKSGAKKDDEEEGDGKR